MSLKFDTQQDSLPLQDLDVAPRFKPVAAVSNSERVVPAERARPRPSLPILALAAVVFLFLVAGSIKVARTPPAPKVKASDFSRLIRPEFQAPEPDTVGFLAYERLIKEYRKLSSHGMEDALKAAAVFQRAGPDEKQFYTAQLQRFVESESFEAMLQAAESPSIQSTPISEGAGFYNLPACLLVGAKYPALVHRKDQHFSERCYKALFSLYPRLEANPRSNSVFASYAAANFYAQAVRDIRAQNPDTGLLARLLDVMPESPGFGAEKGYIRFIITRLLIEDLVNPTHYERYREPGPSLPGEIDFAKTLELAQTEALKAMQDLEKPWSDQRSPMEGALVISNARASSTPQPRSLLDEVLRKPRSGNNQLGLSILQSHLYQVSNINRGAFMALANYRAARTMLGITLYERSRGAFPETLGELVKAGIFKKLPVDPFSGRPFGYDPSKRLIYSVGENGVDQSGLSNDLSSADLPRDDIRYVFGHPTSNR